MNNTFSNTPFNQNISGWDTGNVREMTYAFGGSSFDQDISGWSTTAVTSCGNFSLGTPATWIVAEKPAFTNCTPEY